MNKIKIIAIATAGLLSGHGQAVDLTFTTNDGKQMTFPKDTACISTSIKSLCNDLCDEDGNVQGAIPLSNVSEQELNQVMKDQVQHVLDIHKGLTLNNIGELSYQDREVSSQKAARALPPVEPSREELPKRLQERLANLKVVHYLDIPELIERDACIIACMLRSAESRRLLLGRGDQADAYKVLVHNINDPKHRVSNTSYGAKIYQYMPHDFWMMEHELPHNEYDAVTPENLVGISSRDGKYVVTRSPSDRLAIFWDANSGNIKFTLQYDGMISSEIFSADGKQVVLATGDDAKVCTIADDRLQVNSVLSHGNRVRSAMFSHDGAKIGTAAGNFARIWDVKTGKMVSNPLQHESSVCAAVFSPTENWMMTAAQNGAVHIWDASNGSSLHTWNQQQNVNNQQAGNIEQVGDIQYAVLSPDGKKIGIMFSNKRVKVIDAKKGVELVKPTEHTGGFMQAVFSSDGTKIATVSGSTVHVWDAQNGALLLTLPHQGRIGLAIFSPGEDKILTISGKKINILDAQQCISLVDPRVQENEIASAAFSSDGTRLLITTDSAGALLKLVTAHTLDQALLLWLIDKDGKISVDAWAKSVMNLYSVGEQKLIKEMIKSRKNADNKKCTIS